MHSICGVNTQYTFMETPRATRARRLHSFLLGFIPVVLSEAKNLARMCAGSHAREILRFTQEDRLYELKKLKNLVAQTFRFETDGRHQV